MIPSIWSHGKSATNQFSVSSYLGLFMMIDFIHSKLIQIMGQSGYVDDIIHELQLDANDVYHLQHTCKPRPRQFT